MNKTVVAVVAIIACAAVAIGYFIFGRDRYVTVNAGGGKIYRVDRVTGGSSKIAGDAATQVPAAPSEAPVKQKQAANKELSEAKRFALAKECAIAGKKYSDAEERKIAELQRQYPDSPVSQPSYEYHYNSRLNTCLIFSVSFESSHGKIIPCYYLADAFSNKSLLASDPLLSSQGLGVSPEEFIRQKEILFKE